MTRLSAHVIVYGASCPACTQAKAVLDRFGIPSDARAMTDFPRRHGRVTTMPQILIDGDLWVASTSCSSSPAPGLERIAQGKDAPCLQIKRRIGRGHQVVLRDALGRAQITRSAASRTEALETAATLIGKAHTAEL